MNPEKESEYLQYFSFFILTFILLLSSCVSQRNLEYLRSNRFQDTFNDAVISDYRLQVNDALYIQINSIDDAASNVFAQSAAQQTIEPYGAYMNSYSVDKEGNIEIAVIGRIKVLGKTTVEVGNLIKDSLVNILSIPMVTVKLVNRYVSILGEVRNPGHYVYSQDKFTIYNALGLAGDITDYGNRKEVVLTRNENGKNIKTKIDLTRADILASPYYYIQPNDLIYVGPMKKKIWGMKEFPFTVIFSTITTALLIYTLIDQQ